VYGLSSVNAVFDIGTTSSLQISTSKSATVADVRYLVVAHGPRKRLACNRFKLPLAETMQSFRNRSLSQRDESLGYFC